jgi:hypothetical protein
MVADVIDRAHYLLDDVQKSSSSFLSKLPGMDKNASRPAGAKRRVGPWIDQLINKKIFLSRTPECR